ncbi:MAG: hypothetical protein Q7R92_05945 [bacterium]|nr:hypothetical protein [bacterium]
MPYFIKYTKSTARENKWKKIIDFTKINKGGVNIDAIILSICRDKKIAIRLEKLASLALKK